MQILIGSFFRQFDISGNRKAVVIHVPFRLRKAYRKIHVRLVRELEKKFSGKVRFLVVSFIRSICLCLFCTKFSYTCWIFIGQVWHLAACHLTFLFLGLFNLFSGVSFLFHQPWFCFHNSICIGLHTLAEYWILWNQLNDLFINSFFIVMPLTNSNIPWNIENHFCERTSFCKTLL